MTEKVSDYIALDWYDGPLLQIATVDFEEPRLDGVPKRLIQVCTFCTTHFSEASADEALAVSAQTGKRGATFGQGARTRAVIRLSRDDLQAMLDLYDGKPVKDYNDR